MTDLSSSVLVKSGSRESSEFEFVGGKSSVVPMASSFSSGSTAIAPGASQAELDGPPRPASLSTSNPTATHNSENKSGLFGGILSKVAEKTKLSMETMITTLDPQMKDYLYTGSEISVVVASDKDAKVCSVRDAFQKTFGRGASVYGLATPPVMGVAEQPVGFAAGRQAALERVQSLRARGHDDDVIVAIEGFLFEVGDNDWVELACLILSDAKRNINLTGYSQPTPVDPQFVQMARSTTPDDYPKIWSGLAVTVGSVVAKTWDIPHQQWHTAVCGVARREILHLAASALAGQYQRALAKCNSA